MKSKSSHEPTALAFFELNVEEQAAAVEELGTWACQFVEASPNRRKPWDSIIRARHPIIVVSLADQIISELSTQVVGLVEHLP